MDGVLIDEARLLEAASAGTDEFVDVFYDAIMDYIGGLLAKESMGRLNVDQLTLVAFKIMHDEVMDGGFVQLIYNGYGPFLFFNPFAKVVRMWGLDDLAAIVNKGGRLFRKYGKDIERDCSDEEFMAMFEQYPEFDELDDRFVENEERWVGEIANYIDNNIEKFALVVKAEQGKDDIEK